MFRASEICPGILTSIEMVQDTGVNAAKDCMSVKEFLQIENQSEEKLNKIRAAQKFAPAVLKEFNCFVRKD